MESMSSSDSISLRICWSSASICLLTALITASMDLSAALLSVRPRRLVCSVRTCVNCRRQVTRALSSVWFPERFFASRGWALNDLDRWHALELERPDTFSGMYELWLQKP